MIVVIIPNILVSLPCVHHQLPWPASPGTLTPVMAQKPHLSSVLSLGSFSELYCRDANLCSFLLGGPETCAVASPSPRWTLSPQCSLCPALSPFAPDQRPWMAPMPDLSHRHVWDDWWTLSAAFSSAATLRCGGLVCPSRRTLPVLGLPGALRAASPLSTLACPTGPWSGTPATENRPWHPGAKPSCLWCSWKASCISLKKKKNKRVARV